MSTFKSNKPQNYYLGIDGGVSSDGWAVTDTEYNLVRLNGKDMWGSYLFDEADTAAKRRGYRQSRRRAMRTRQRLNYLQEIFAEEIEKVDPLFYIRLNNSSLFLDDKDSRLTGANSLFNDDRMCEREYYDKYPTIYHLRYALMSGEIADIRLLYLGIHHIMKNRGHFLFEGQDFNARDTKAIVTSFNEINIHLNELGMSKYDLGNIEEVIKLLKNTYINKTEKFKTMKDILQVGKDKQLASILKLILGFKDINVKNLFDLEENDLKIDLLSANFDEKLAELDSVLGEEQIDIIRNSKAIYDFTVLINILGDNIKYISEAKVKTYEQHKDDLHQLKEYVSLIGDRDLYNKIFSSINNADAKEKLNNYAAYVGMNKKKSCKRCKREEFYDFLKKELDLENREDETAKLILLKMENDNYLPKLRSNINGSIPMQLHRTELKIILEKAKSRFGFLESKDNTGLTALEKILKVFDFRIPYYIGPLNSNSNQAWFIKKESEENERGKSNTKITPWSFDKVVDRDKSEIEFIRRMTNKCTYIYGEDVLPKFSLVYSEFAFLNELNNMTIAGEKNTKAKCIIYDYAQTHKSITKKTYVKLLKEKGIIEDGSEIGGLDGDFKNTLRSKIDFEFLSKRNNINSEDIEDIILRITLTSDKSRLEDYLKRKYRDKLTDEDIKRIKSLNYSKWGRLSKCMLDGIKSKVNGEEVTILEAMRSTTENLQQLLSKKYGYLDEISELNNSGVFQDNSQTIKYQTVENINCSPAIKRSIWRTIQLVNEVIQIMGKKPKKIFVEMARELNDNPQKGKRTKSRRLKLVELLEGLKKTSRDKEINEKRQRLLHWVESLVDLDNWIREIKKKNDYDFRSNKVYLYYSQLGRDMYTGKEIKYTSVMNTSVFDRDHIYPQSKIKDDSLDNLVLTLKKVNSNKSDEYPIKNEIRQDRAELWLGLRDCGLISQAKYARLIRDTPLTENEIKDFINRQLSFTRQINKITCELLERMLNYSLDEQGNFVKLLKDKRSKIVYSKAGNTFDLKCKIGYIKIREQNDLHHAKDAYLNIVAGNVYDVKFSQYFHDYAPINLTKIYDYSIEGAWDKEYLKNIERTVQKDSCQVVRMAMESKGQLFDDNLITAKEGLLPQKGNGNKDNPLTKVERYGGYEKVRVAYFMIVKSRDKYNNEIISFEDYPIIVKIQKESMNMPKEDRLKVKRQYLESKGLIDPVIIVEEVKPKTLMRYDGSFVYLNGKTNGDRISISNANQLFLDKEYEVILKRVVGHVKMSTELGVNLINPSKKKDGSTTEKDIKLKAWIRIDENNKCLMNEDELRSDNVKLYDEFVKKLKLGMYNGVGYGDQLELLNEGRDDFKDLTVEEECFVLKEILKLLQAGNTQAANLVLIGGTKYMGKKSISKYIVKTPYKSNGDVRQRDGHSLQIYSLSPTGYYKSVVDIDNFKGNAQNI